MVGPFEIVYGSITHSVPESSILSISVGSKLIVHSGDWKIDKNPLVGQKTDIKFLKNLSNKGVDGLVCDSTNVFNTKNSGSENDVRKNLLGIIKKSSSSRVFVTTFASNIARLSTLIYIAEKLKIKICFMGGSLNRSFEIARSCGYLNKSSNQINFSDISDKEKTIIVCTGCQGEPRAILSRITNDFHKLKFKDNDLVIFSSKIIPGNEKKIGNIINKITRLGAKVITEKDDFVHVSGHPGREELEYLYGVLKPKSLIPVHGEARHLYEHANFAKKMGIEHQVIVNNGDLVNLSEEKINVESTVHSGRLLLDGNKTISVSSELIKERIRIRDNGVIFILFLNIEKKHITFYLSSIGVIEDNKKLEELISKEIKKNHKLNLINKNNIDLIVRQCVNRVIKSFSEKRPKVLIKFTEDFDSKEL